MKCERCKCGSVVKHGFVRRRVGLTRRYLCKKCGYKFIKNDGFKQYRHDSNAITAALDLRAKGLSLADVVDHLDQHHKVKISRKTILDWQRKFGEKLKSFSQTLTPFLGDVFHADEMFFKVRKLWNYYWDCMDYWTKFLVADHVSNIREDKEAVLFLNKIKKESPRLPSEIHTDCSYDYPPAFKKVFPRRRIHVQFPAWKKKFKNNPIERLHNTIKQRYKTFRGFDNIKSSTEFFDFYKVYYNFIRKHTSLGFITPAQAAKIELNLGRNRFKSLIERQWPKPNLIRLFLS
ncbi:MAG: DDE-type integrase/transposase/recombinase [Nanoarchaeota archaeon]|nr:DDE-type integrase/transposase/recombinase [Nanoarchaeota archaeon]MBU1974768.1 DDE-type integrase/transposase/recombinase [Nanoarchaeota archaeon]